MQGRVPAVRGSGSTRPPVAPTPACCPHPTGPQVKECLRLAARGQEYQPGGGGAGQAAAAGESGQRHEQELHEDEATLQAQAAAEAGGEGAAAQQDDRLPGGGAVLSVQGGGGRHGGVKRIDGVAVGQGGLGASRLGLYGVLLWAGGLVGAFFLLPVARRATRRAGALLPQTNPYKQKGRED